MTESNINSNLNSKATIIKNSLINTLETWALRYIEQTPTAQKTELLMEFFNELDHLVQNYSESQNEKTENLAALDKSVNSNQTENIVDHPPYEYLVFSGGGIRGFAFLGALATLLHKWPTLLLNCKGFAGTSIGAFVALLNVLGLSPFEIDEYLSTANANVNMLNFINYRQFGDFFHKWTSSSSSQSSSSSPSTSAVMTADALETPVLGAFQYADQKNIFNRSFFQTSTTSANVIQTSEDLIKVRQIFADKILTRKFSTLTFNDLYLLTRRELAVVVTNMSTKRSEVHSFKTTPNYCVVASVCASMTIPFIFPAVEINHQMFVDGGIANNFPIKLWPLEKTLGLCLCSPGELIYEHYVEPNLHKLQVLHQRLLEFSKNETDKCKTNDVPPTTTNTTNSDNTSTNSTSVSTNAGNASVNGVVNNTVPQKQQQQTEPSTFLSQIKSIFKSFQLPMLNNTNSNKSSYNKPSSFGAFEELTSLTAIAFDQLQYNIISSLDQNQVSKSIMFVNTEQWPTLTIAVSSEQKQGLLECGFKSAYLWLQRD